VDENEISDQNSVISFDSTKLAIMNLTTPAKRFSDDNLLKSNKHTTGSVEFNDFRRDSRTV